MAEEAKTGADTPVPQKPCFGLSGKLLVLTILFVMIAEILIYVPSIANFRLSWLSDRLSSAHTAALVFDAAPSGAVPESLARQLLESVGAKSVAMKKGPIRRLLASSEMLPPVDFQIDVRNVKPFEAIVDAFMTLWSGDGLLLAVGPAPMGGDFVEIVVENAPLRQAMVRFSINILLLSLAISAISATLVYLALHFIIVRPMSRLTDKMVAFRNDPENPARIVTRSGRRDEIGIAETEFAAMQRDLASMLQQKTRLAALGLAVSKVNHEMRNLLASVLLISDQLARISEPSVQRFAPKLVTALERAITYCQSTLSYGRAQEAAPQRKPTPLQPLADEVCATLGLGSESPIRSIPAIERGLVVDADPDQLFRVLLNLTRNAVQALESRAPNDRSRDHIRVAGRREGAVVVIEVSDTGPGVPPKAREHLFEAFQSTRRGGSGLGLAIAAELIRAHGGDIGLVEGTIGATFRIVIPDRAVEIGAVRNERARA